jgi:hypothetical protein
MLPIRINQKVVKINDAIYMAPATGNVYLVTTPAEEPRKRNWGQNRLWSKELNPLAPLSSRAENIAIPYTVPLQNTTRP